MRSMSAVFKRELQACLIQPTAYAMMGSLLFIVGLLYYLYLRHFLDMSFENFFHSILNQYPSGKSWLWAR